jgi:hypothetical protein
VHVRIFQDPLQRGQHGALPLQSVVYLVSRLGPAESARHDFHGYNANPGLGGRLDQRIHGWIHGEVVGGENDVKMRQLADDSRNELRLPAVRADTDKSHLAFLLGYLLRFHQLIGELFRFASGVQMPDIHVIGSQLFQAGAEVIQRLLLRAGSGFGGDDEILPLGFERCSHHALVVSLLVATCGIKVVDPEIGCFLNHTLVRSNHATEADGCYL